RRTPIDVPGRRPRGISMGDMARLAGSDFHPRAALRPGHHAVRPLTETERRAPVAVTVVLNGAGAVLTAAAGRRVAQWARAQGAVVTGSGASGTLVVRAR